MGERIPMDDHRLIDRLLPWYVNNTLDAGEHRRVRHHLDSCAACQANVSLLATVQSTVRHETATPMVPPPRTERFLEAVNGLERKKTGLRSLTIMAVAASLGAALVVVTLLLPRPKQAATVPVRYETTTAPAGGMSMDYVLDLQFEPGVSLAAQTRVLRGLEAKDIDRIESDGMYRITVNLPAASLEELERYTSDLESLGEVRTVSAVAVQLPMKRRE